jgi:hypothetical protein
MNLLNELRTKATACLVEAGNPTPTTEQVEAQCRWLLALWQAETISQIYDLKDIAQMCLNGMKPIVDAETECELIDEDEVDSLVDFLRLA